MSKLSEYKILTGTASECETTLNEWKEMYDLYMLHMCRSVEGVTILLLRVTPLTDKGKTQ